MSTIYQKALETWSKNVTVLRFIKLCKFTTAHYFQTASYKFVSWSHRLYCIVFGLSVIIYTVYPFKTTFFFLSIEFIFSLSLSLITADEYFFKYCRATETLDLVMGLKSRSIFDNGIRCLLVIWLLLRIIFSYINFSAEINIYFYISGTVVMFSEGIDFFVVIIVFYILFTRIKIIRRRFEVNPIPVNIVNKNNVMNIMKQVRRCLLDYNNLLDNIHDINQELQCLMCISLMCCVPKTIMFVYRMLYRSTFETFGSRHVVQQIETIEALVLISLPSVLAELIRHEVDQIKETLSKQLLRCSDESLRHQLQIALEYVERRPFRFVLFNAIPVDISLPIGIISLCITYTIVVIQFTHFGNRI